MMVIGVVKKGKRRGSTLGYPTLNIAMSGKEGEGIYAAIVAVGEKIYQAAAFADPSRRLLEAHLLGFSGDLYGKEVAVELKKKIRDSEKFETDAALRAAIAEDVNAVRQFFENEERANV